MAVVHVTDDSFKTEVGQGSGKVIVDFWAPWCGPCKAMSPILDQLAAENEGELKVAKVNVDDNQAAAAEFGIMSIPTLILFKDGVPVDKAVGLQSKESLKEWIQSH